LSTGGLNNVSNVGISQIQGVNGNLYPNIFNDTDLSMMDEMNKILVGFKGDGNSVLSKQRLSLKTRFKHQR
jgi:hypothetical protein